MDLNWKKEYSRYKGYFLNVFEATQKKKDIKMFLEILLTLTAIIIFTAFALRPTLLTISELLKEIDAKEELIEKMDTKIANLTKASTLLKQKTREIALLDAAIPKEPKPDLFARQVEGTATVNSTALLGLSIDEVTLVGEEKAKRVREGVQELPRGANSLIFSINSSGEFSSISSFISYLERMRRPIQIETLNINKPIEEITNILTISITGQTPYVKEQVENTK